MPLLSWCRLWPKHLCGKGEARFSEFLIQQTQTLGQRPLQSSTNPQFSSSHVHGVLCEWMHAAHSGGTAHMPPPCEHTLLSVWALLTSGLQDPLCVCVLSFLALWPGHSNVQPHCHTHLHFTSTSGMDVSPVSLFSVISTLHSFFSVHASWTWRSGKWLCASLVVACQCSQGVPPLSVSPQHSLLCLPCTVIQTNCVTCLSKMPQTS